MSQNRTSKLNYKTIPVLPSLDHSLIFPFHIIFSPVHPTGFYHCFSLASLLFLFCYHRTKTTTKSSRITISKNVQTPLRSRHIYMKDVHCAKPNRKLIFLIFNFRVIVDCIYNLLVCHLNFKVCHRLKKILLKAAIFTRKMRIALKWTF